MNTTTKAETCYAIIAADKSGPAYGIGVTPVLAREDAREAGFGDDGICVEITVESYDRIAAGNPDAVEIVR